MKSKVIYTVAGTGRFPVDMLRYDEAYPLNVESVSAIESDRRDSREVTLAAERCTEGRWNSFMWVVTSAKEVMR